MRENPCHDITYLIHLWGFFNFYFFKDFILFLCLSLNCKKPGSIPKSCFNRGWRPKYTVQTSQNLWLRPTVDLKSPRNARYSCPAQKQTQPLGNPEQKGLERKRLEIKREYKKNSRFKVILQRSGTWVLPVRAEYRVYTWSLTQLIFTHEHTHNVYFPVFLFVLNVE